MDTFYILNGKSAFGEMTTKNGGGGEGRFENLEKSFILSFLTRKLSLVTIGGLPENFNL